MNKFKQFIKNYSVAIFSCMMMALLLGVWFTFATPTKTIIGDDVIISGNLGVGVENPQAKLDVDGDIKLSGQIEKTESVAFFAHRGSSKTYNSGAKIDFNVVVFDHNGDYNPATGEFTAPVSGMYIITFATGWLESGRISPYINKNGSRWVNSYRNHVATYLVTETTFVDYLAEGDVIYVTQDTDSKTMYGSSGLYMSYFNVVLLYKY